MRTLIMLLISLMMVFPITALASDVQVDRYGNVIDWDTEGEGGEDSAGSEGASDYNDAANVYTFTEQLEMIEEMESLRAEEPQPEETGYITISFDEPDDWSRNNISVTLWNKTYDIKEEVWLYRQNRYTAREEVPVGEYTFWKAETAAGEEFSCDMGTFTVESNRPASITLTYGKASPHAEIIEDANPDAVNKENDTGMEEEEGEAASSHFKRNAELVAAIVFLVGFFGLMCWMRNRRRHSDGTYHNDLMD